VNLVIKQQVFLINLAKLILYINEKGYGATGGELYRTPEQAEINAAKGIGIKNSLHCKRLAIDLMVFKNGVWCTDGDSYKPFGEYWKSLNTLNRWGGDFKLRDYVHFEMEDK
jgi:hypothetical protein